MESSTLATLLLFAALLCTSLVAVARLHRRNRRRHVVHRARKSRTDRQRLTELLQDDIGQKFAAARIDLSAVRLQLRTGGVPVVAELDAAMSLLDDGCRDLRTVSRLMAASETGSAVDLKVEAEGARNNAER